MLACKTWLIVFESKTWRPCAQCHKLNIQRLSHVHACPHLSDNTFLPLEKSTRAYSLGKRAESFSSRAVLTSHVIG